MASGSSALSAGYATASLNVCHSYDQARQAADYQTIKEDGDVVWYSALPGENVRYYYPMQLEERLIYLAKHWTKAGNLHDIVRYICREF